MRENRPAAQSDSVPISQWPKVDIVTVAFLAPIASRRNQPLPSADGPSGMAVNTDGEDAATDWLLIRENRAIRK